MIIIYTLFATFSNHNLIERIRREGCKMPRDLQKESAGSLDRNTDSQIEI